MPIVFTYKICKVFSLYSLFSGKSNYVHEHNESQHSFAIVYLWNFFTKGIKPDRRSIVTTRLTGELFNNSIHVY